MNFDWLPDVDHAAHAGQSDQQRQDADHLPGLALRHDRAHMPFQVRRAPGRGSRTRLRRWSLAIGPVEPRGSHGPGSAGFLRIAPEGVGHAHATSR